MRSILVVLLMFLGSICDTYASDRFPGSYVVTIKGELPNGEKYSKLAMYSFRAGATSSAGSLRQDFWIWFDKDQNTTTTGTQTYGLSNTLIGTTGGQNNPDSNRKIFGINSFINSPPKTLINADWQVVDYDSDGNPHRIEITWNSGSREYWMVTWADSNLNKIELQSAGYTYGDLFLPTPASVQRNRFSQVVGWGFGGKGPGFNSAFTGRLSDKNYAGWIMRFNAWSLVNEPVGFSLFKLNRDFTTTNTGVSRYRAMSTTKDSNGNIIPVKCPDGISNRYVYSYLYPMGSTSSTTPPDTNSFTNRKVIYQTGNDFNCNDHIEDDYGHTYAGLQIVDAAGKSRGMVFADSSYAQVYGGHTVSALYYLDTNTYSSRVGVDPSQ